MTLPLRRLDPLPPPVALHERAMDDLRFIRRTMERAGSFTAVPGWGIVAVGAIGLAAAVPASLQPEPERWLAAWLATAALASAVGAAALARKAGRAGVALRTGPGRRFLLGFAPPIVAAAALTAALCAHGAFALLPGLWLLSYGAAVAAAGAFSVAAVPRMGIAFMALGALALATPGSLGDAWMAAGFGGVHVAFGLAIARRHGG